MTVTFATRSCGHRVPVGRTGCPYCCAPRLDARPLRDLICSRVVRSDHEAVSLNVATRLGMSFQRIDRQLRRIVSGETTRVSHTWADRLAIALRADPVVLWGDEWFDASPAEPYGDEDD